MNTLINKFSQINSTDVKSVGGKNSSLGEMFNQLSPKGINIPDGFATTVDAWWLFLESNHLKEKLSELMNGLDKKSFSNLREVGNEARQLVLNGTMPVIFQRLPCQPYLSVHLLH